MRLSHSNEFDIPRKHTCPWTTDMHWSAAALEIWGWQCPRKSVEREYHCVDNHDVPKEVTPIPQVKSSIVRPSSKVMYDPEAFSMIASSITRPKPWVVCFWPSERRAAFVDGMTTYLSFEHVSAPVIIQNQKVRTFNRTRQNERLRPNMDVVRFIFTAAIRNKFS